MMNKRRLPYYPILFAAFPSIALMAYNQFQTNLDVLFRPLFVSILFSLMLFALTLLLYKKNWHKAALISGATILLIFSYGHIFNLIQSSNFLNTLFGRHRIVMGIFGFVWFGVLMISIKRDVGEDFTQLINIFSLILIAFPLVQLGTQYLSENIAKNRAESGQIEGLNLNDQPNFRPDVYYIILDSYSRPDALLENHNIDVMPFIQEMEKNGFYYASESQSNYDETFSSLTTSLNMQYLDQLVSDLNTSLGSPIYQESIKSSKTRAIFESMGYQTVAFSTGYRWSEFSTADIYYPIESTNPLRALTPFEALLFQTLIFYPYRGYLFDVFPASIDNQIDSPHSLHIEAQRNVLEKLPQVAQNPNPTFTFAHILIPHPPLVFDEDGSILQDPGYYSGDKASAINDFYEADGYERQVKFVSQQILTITEQILEASDTNPIIIVQADHGWKADHRLKILNLYYFPDEDYEILYPSITPVNSFRAVFSKYFAMDFDLIEDQSFQ